MSEHDFDRLTHFPIKLWDVVNDEGSTIFKWSADGESFFVDEQRYENQIMDKYPGFVQRSSFPNLRRLLREYSFKWRINEQTGEYEFSHPGFRQGQKDQLLSIMTKRKTQQVANGYSTKLRRRAPGNSRRSKDMSKAWLQPSAKGGVNLWADTLMRFPEKFWAVVNDPNDLLYWSDHGDSIIVDDQKYSEEIMARYPGFVKTKSFGNLKRLLREYGFTWNIRENGFYEFSHTNMRRGRPDLLKGVKTKRKALKAGAPHPYLPCFKHGTAYPAVPSPKCYNGEQFEYMEGSCRVASEVNQAVGSIRAGASGDGKEFFHGRGDHHQMSAQIYGIPSYQLIPPYSHLGGHSHLHQTNAWAFSGGGDKLESSYYYPHWHGENKVDISPSMAQESSSGIQASSNGSCESVYASMSKESRSDLIEPSGHGAAVRRSHSVAFQSDAHDQDSCSDQLYQPVMLPPEHKELLDHQPQNLMKLSKEEYPEDLSPDGIINDMMMNHSPDGMKTYHDDSNSELGELIAHTKCVH